MTRWPRLLSVDDAAAYLSVSRSTVRRLVKPVPVGSRVLFDRHELDRFADALAAAPERTTADRAFGVE